MRDEAERARLVGLLEGEGLAVHACQGLDSALEVIDQVTPCLAFVDYPRPGDGAAPGARLRAHPRAGDMALILLVDSEDAAHVEAGLAAGALDLLRRTLDDDTLRARVRMQVGLHEARREQARLSQRLRLISEAATDGIVLIGRGGVISYWNRAAERMFGWSAAEAMGQNIHDLVAAPSLREEAHAATALFDTTGEGGAIGKTVVLRAVRRGGEEFPVELSLSSTLVDGEWWALAIVRDITQRLAFERRLRHSETQLRWILDNVPVGIAISGAERHVRWANQAVLRMVEAQDADEIAGLPCHAAFCQSECGPCDLSGLDGDGMRAEFQLPRRYSAPLPVMRSVHKLDQGGETVYLETFVDLTARRQLEAELGHARKLEAVGQLAAGIAHEINTPIQYVGDSLHFLAEVVAAVEQVRGEQGALLESLACAEADSLRAELARIEAEADLAFMVENAPASLGRCFDGVQRVSAIVRAMKEFAHPDQRDMEPADLNAAIESTLTIARHEYKYVAQIERDYGDIAPVTCHIGDLNQVFLNLIVNAAHAIAGTSAVAGQLGTITVRTRQVDGEVRITITDTGGGIPDAIADRVFEPFFTTKPVGQGSGQGLAIARSIVVDRHGGSLTFVSQAGVGTEFTVLLPLAGRSVDGAVGS